MKFNILIKKIIIFIIVFPITFYMSKFFIEYRTEKVTKDINKTLEKIWKVQKLVYMNPNSFNKWQVDLTVVTTWNEIININMQDMNKRVTEHD